MGTVPLPAGQTHQQTWDGIADGEPLLTMSCSDKILRFSPPGQAGGGEILLASEAALEHVEADPDPTSHLDANPDLLDWRKEDKA